MRPIDFAKAAGLGAIILVIDVTYAALLVFFYAFFDGASVAFAGFFTLGIAVTMLLKLIGALPGAFLARA